MRGLSRPKQRDPLTAVRQDLGLLLDQAAAKVQQRVLMDTAVVVNTRRLLEVLFDYFIAIGWTAAAMRRRARLFLLKPSDLPADDELSEAVKSRLVNKEESILIAHLVTTGVVPPGDD